jgi:hypothetical protein
MYRFALILVAPTLGSIALMAFAQEPPDKAKKLPNGGGLSARYAGDKGMAKDGSVLLAEDFESGAIADLAKRWDSVSNKDGRVIAFSDDTPPDSSGKRSLQMTATLGKNEGGHLYTRLRRPVEKVFVRFYVKFPKDAEYIHHFVHLGGYNPPTPWPQGGAGTRPKGHERVTVGIEPYGARGTFPAPGAWFFYAYWPEMKVSAGGRYWGNGLKPAKAEAIPRDRWNCVEVMMKLNSDPNARDGELALWTDGQLKTHIAKGVRRGPWSGMGFDVLEKGGEPFEGFRFRTDPKLKINFLWLLHYVTENAAKQNRVREPNPTNCVWFDDIVVAERYIGPIQRDRRVKE